MHTDVISHSTPLFPTRTGDEFLGMLRAIAASPPGTASPSPIEQFLGAHPAAFAFVTAPKPTPASYVLETYYGINAMKATNASGETKYFRYRVVPLAGEKVLTEEELAQKDAGFLHEELLARLGGGGDEVVLKLYAQIANEGDVIDDATVQWPESRNLVELGAIKLESAVEENEKEQKHIIFDPVPRVEGLEPSKDPLLELRAALYLISGRERRAA